MTPPEAVQAVTIEPDGTRWPLLIHAARSRSGGVADDARLGFRRELGLPTDRPIIMVGHQAQWWHPGIVAKYCAAVSAARRSGAAVVWLWVDQDDEDPAAVLVPVRDAAGRLAARTGRLSSAPIAVGVPSGSAPPFSPVQPDLAGAVRPRIRSGFESAVAALSASAAERSAARQTAAAVQRLLSGLVQPDAVLFATEFHRSAAFRAAVERLTSDPGPAISAYNAAAHRHPEAGLAPLASSAKGIELPLWRLAPGAPRRRVSSAEPAGEVSDLAPRAILMTALLRQLGCELFVHGRGGWAYDAVAEEWFRDWLGEPLSPMALATADVVLPLGGRPVGPAEVAAARWRAHAAAHNPAMLGRQSDAAEKSALVAKIAALPRRSPERRALYSDMHRRIAGARHMHSEELTRLRAAADDAAVRAAEWRTASRRDWPFFCYEPEVLAELAARIDRRFGSRS
ncbi:MAG: hypothetical protein IBJ11_00350 [Phycisphaerales bacterium]|nr:hypothetical protein [Phycisphaerales bacterium]